METKTETMYIVATILDSGKQWISLKNDDYGSVMDDWVTLGKIDVDYEIPEQVFITDALIEALEDKKKTMQATASAAIAEVEGQIQNLRALPMHEVV